MTEAYEASISSRNIQTIATGVGFAEGPVITPEGEVFVTSIDHGRVYRITDAGAETFAELGGGANGATLGEDGTLYVAQNGGRWSHQGPAWGLDSVGGVQAVQLDGSVQWVTQDPISPNDLCFGPDGYLYVTDPTRAPRGADGRIWRVDTDSGEAELLLSVPWFPNGIGFGAGDAVYLASTWEASIVRFTLNKGQLADPETVIEMEYGYPDGFAFDAEGNLLVGAISDTEDSPGEIQVWSPSGSLLDTLRPGPGSKYTNIALGEDRTLIIAGSSLGEVLSVEEWPVAGLPLHPFRS
jgi:gluconolactonase